MTHQAPPPENPLLTPSLLPRFADIEPAHVEPAVREMLAAQRAALLEAERVEAPDLGWLRHLERINDEIQRVWGPVSHLNNVLSTPPLRDAYNRCLPLVTEFGTELGQNETLYRQFAALKERTAATQSVEQALIDQALRDFRLGGVSLVGPDRDRFRTIMQELAAAQASFEQNVMDATDAFEHRESDRAALRGLPERLIEGARVLAEHAGAKGWLLRLDPPTYQTVMAHAENAELRAKYYEAWVTRASDRGPHAGRWDNGALIERIMALRHEAARLVGFQTYTEFSLATKMADSPERVIEFLLDLARRSRPMAERELAELTRYAGRKLSAWDTAYYAERMRQEKLHLAEEELRPYFPLPQVQAGLFALCGKLFGLTIEERPNTNVWYPTVRYYEIRRSDGTQIGSFFTDLFARQNKRGGAWLDTCRSRARLGALEHLPVAHLVCNFNAPSGETPSLLTHMEAVTLFHEFGHALHHLLTEVDYPSIAGINGVAWDAVELPSQFLENFVWHPDVLASMARHYQTGEPLPREKLDALNKSRTFLAGLAMMRQIEFALFDFKLHHEYDPARGSRVLDVLDEVRREVAVVEAPAFNRFPHSFGHVFGGGYAAGYYSYKWAEVLAADAFAAFEEHGIFDVDTAERFRRAILATGGSRNALDAFVEFRGREPSLDPLLEQSGIATQ